MPKLIIDGRKIEVEAGTPVIAAAERLGIMIPRFCYHEALGSAGACRMCAVMFLDGPVKGLDMSCMVKAKDGMVVSTDHPEAQAFRASVIEWLMVNHPHDCPVCDEGGHCLLQDMTVSGGHSLRRYRGRKRTHRDQDLGPLVQHEMNRCIQCYRCVRFYREYAGGQDFGVFGISTRVYFGRQEPGRLESPFAGNLIDICPTGVFTDKPSRYRARRWDLERAHSVCLHCSLGCNLTAGARYRDIVRMEARLNPEVNGYFLCDRGRYGYEYASLPARPRRARLDGREAGYREALDETARRLRQAVAAKGPASVALLGSMRSSLEGLAGLAALAESLGCPPPAYFFSRAEREACRAFAAALDQDIACSLEAVRRADCVLAVGVDPLQEAPVLALAMRQAARNGTLVAALDPRPVELACEVSHLPAQRGELALLLAALLRHALPQDTPPQDALHQELRAFHETLPSLPESADLNQETFARVAEALGRAKRPVLVCGSEVIARDLPDLAAAAVRALRALGRDAGLFPVLPGADSLGAAMLDSPDAKSFEELLTALESGEITALVCAEADPLAEYPEAERVEEALDGLELLVVLDALPSALVERAHLFLPTQTVFEAGGLFVNQEGRVQQAHAAFAGGEPIRQTSNGGHPPRVFSAEVPGDAPRALAAALAQVRDRTRETPAATGDSAPDLSDPMELLRTRLPGLAPFLGNGVPASGVPAHGVSILPSAVPRALEAVPLQPAEDQQPEQAEVLVVRRTFGTEELANHGTLMPHLAGEPLLFLHADDAARHGLVDGDELLLPLGGGQARGTLRTSADMARGCVVLPRRAEAGWRTLDRAPNAGATIDLARIEKKWPVARPAERAVSEEVDVDLTPGEQCPWRAR